MTIKEEFDAIPHSDMEVAQKRLRVFETLASNYEEVAHTLRQAFSKRLELRKEASPMSNYPNCGAAEIGGISGMWQCGTRNPKVPTLTCQNHKLHDGLAQANAVVDAITTLMENGRTTVSIGPGVDYNIKVVTNDKARGFSWARYSNTLREALEACVATRDQYDREKGKK